MIDTMLVYREQPTLAGASSTQTKLNPLRAAAVCPARTPLIS
ncbi:hypothetical protein [Rhodoferax sp.]|nr:hypothetical protein [Rhodoferax sp.]